MNSNVYTLKVILAKFPIILYIKKANVEWDEILIFVKRPLIPKSYKVFDFYTIFHFLRSYKVDRHLSG